MKAFACVVATVCLLGLVSAQTVHYCNADGDWPQTQAGKSYRLPCPNGQVGHLSRKCAEVTGKGEWQGVNESGCRGKYPNNENLAFVDIDYSYTNCNPSSVDKYRDMIPEHFSKTYNIEPSRITVYEVTASDTYIAMVSIRVSETRTKASNLYTTIAGYQDSIDTAFQSTLTATSVQNKYNYWADRKKGRVSVDEVKLHTDPPKDHTGLVIGVIAGFIVLLILIFVGFYTYIQLKRRTRRGDSTQLKAGGN